MMNHRGTEAQRRGQKPQGTPSLRLRVLGVSVVKTFC
jgi:hypothetical protein